MQLSIQTYESLQNKVGRKNTPQQKRTNHTKQEKIKEHKKNNKNATRSGRKNANPRT